MSFWEVVLAVMTGIGLSLAALIALPFIGAGLYVAWYFVCCEWPDSFMHKFGLGRWRGSR